MTTVVVGAGIVGLAVARELTGSATRSTVLDKEDRVGAHQTGHNSGVVHAGLYYQPGSLKAELCRRGMTLLRGVLRRARPAVRRLRQAGRRRATRASVPGLDAIERRRPANGVPGLRRLDRRRAPRDRAARSRRRRRCTRRAPRSPTSWRSPAASPTTSRRPAADRCRRRGHRHRGGGGVGCAPRRREFSFDRLVVCAGLQADRVAGWPGDAAGPAIVPFRGEYYELRPERTDLVRGLIYPVPDPRYPFLGVHLTRRVDGAVEVGPNAVLAPGPRGLRGARIAAGDLLRASLRWPGFWRMAAQHWRTGVAECTAACRSERSWRPPSRYVPELGPADVVRGGAGVRAQAVDRDGTLVDDFRIAPARPGHPRAQRPVAGRHIVAGHRRARRGPDGAPALSSRASLGSGSLLGQGGVRLGLAPGCEGAGLAEERLGDGYVVRLGRGGLGDGP